MVLNNKYYLDNPQKLDGFKPNLWVELQANATVTGNA